MRKYFKYIVAVILVLISVFMAKAQTSGYGCLVDNAVYTEYLGEEHPYHPSNPLTKFYRFNGNSIDINYNNYNSSQPNNYGYDCTKINIFGASGTGPAQQEYVSQNTSCVTAATLNSSIKGNGTYVYYSYKNPTYCGGTPMPLPLDDYNWVIILGFALIGGFVISKKGMLLA
ncbi:hypothetical protein [Pedobacter frigiditerrae]|uniref:hypothetical protein n=1 Tax=Pedobacter frigiditerrae TaxID=2530452 RepID=UPI002930AB00|nr:hypothetical protein [Pedobacter frigiditerrae]